jgi:hypothetical protein
MFVGCGEKVVTENVKEESEEIVKEEVESEEETPKEEVAEVVKEAVDASSLEGLELIGTLNTTRPEKLKIESEMIIFGATSKISTFYEGNKVRTETDVAGMAKSILINLPEEGAIYQYMYGDTEGVKMMDDGTSNTEGMGIMIDQAELLAAITDESSNDLIAKVDTLDGEEVVYIEATESDEDMGEMLVKMWYSVKYATPMKYQVFAGEEMVMELKVTKILDNINMNESLFLPPSDVTFTEFSMDEMMDTFDE